MKNYCGFNYIGLAINNTTLRAVIVDGAKKKITSLSEQKLDKQVLNGGTFLEHEIFQKMLKKLLEKNKKIPRCISISLPERYALTRELSFPNISYPEIQEAVYWQARNIFPLPIEDMYLDWKVIEGQNQHKEVFVVALPKKLVDDLVKLIGAMGLKPINIQTSATCLGNLLPKKINKLQILVNINNDGTTATLVAGNIAKMTATAPADKNKEQFIFDTINTIDKLKNYYLAKYNNKLNIDNIWITGDRADEEFKERLDKKLQIKTDFLKLPFSMYDEKLAPAFSEAVAIALSPIAPPSSEKTINLLPQEIQEYYNSINNYSKIKKKLQLILSILIFGFVAAAASLSYLFYQARSLIPKTNQAAEQIGNIASTDSLEVKLRGINNDIQKLIVLAKRKTTPKTILSNLPKAIPDGITINSFNFNQRLGELVLQGRASNRETLLLFGQNLENKQEFYGADIPLESLEKKNNYQFSLNIKIKQ